MSEPTDEQRTLRKPISELSTQQELFEVILADANIGAIKQVSHYDDSTHYELKNSGRYGYQGFFSEWIFNSEGSLVAIQHWE